jgi:signal transduction histidine kinase
MAGRSADLLAELALGGPAAPALPQVVQQLAVDPPLALWVICVADSANPASARNLSALAEWLAGHAIEALAEPGAETPTGWTAAQSDIPQFVGRGLLVAELYRAMSGDNASGSADYVSALLSNADQWAGAASAALPDWLVEWKQSESPSVLVQAVSLAATPEDQAVPSVDLAGCRQRAEQNLTAWMAEGRWPDAMLSALASKLARLAELETRFDQTLERERLQAMAEFAAGAGHEINNPLAVIAGRAQLFLREEQDPERRRGLALINAQAMRVYEMIADMRLFARPPAPERTDVDLAQLLDAAVREMASRAAEQDTALSCVSPRNLPTIHADPVQLGVALKALIANSLEALGSGGQVHIEAGERPSDVWIRVVDNGPGIASEERNRIFDPFFSARQAGRGLGMGLAKCWRIVTQHGGQIDVESQPGHGAAFTLRLPR